MKLRELYRDKRHVDISIELFPPKTPEGMIKLFEKIERLKKLQPAFFSMTYGAGGNTARTTLELVDKLKNEIRVETMCHLTVIGQSKAETCEILDQLQGMGVYNLIALRGDLPSNASDFNPARDGFFHAIDLVREAKARRFFSIAVAGFPEMHPDAVNAETDIRYLKEKVDAGADVIITQLFFDNEFYYRFVERVRKTGVKVPIIPGILPILSVKQIRRFTELCKASIPKVVSAELLKFENDDTAAQQYGIKLATEQCQNLLQFGVPGIHFYALNQSQSVEAVLQNLNFPKHKF